MIIKNQLIKNLVIKDKHYLINYIVNKNKYQKVIVIIYNKHNFFINDKICKRCI